MGAANGRIRPLQNICFRGRLSLLLPRTANPRHFKLAGNATRCWVRQLAEAFHNEERLPTPTGLLLNHERCSLHTIAARPAATIKATPLAQSGIVIPLIVMSQPNKSRVSCSKETIEKTIIATRVKGLFIFRSIRKCRDATRNDGLRGA